MGKTITCRYEPTIPLTDEAFTWIAMHPSEAAVLEKFVGLMVGELAANDSKGNRPGWLQMDRKEAVAEIHWHAAKLAVAAKLAETGEWSDGDEDEQWGDVREYAADVANCALMLLDCTGLLFAGGKDQ